MEIRTRHGPKSRVFPYQVCLHTMFGSDSYAPPYYLGTKAVRT